MSYSLHNHTFALFPGSFKTKRLQKKCLIVSSNSSRHPLCCIFAILAMVLGVDRLSLLRKTCENVLHFLQLFRETLAPKACDGDKTTCALVE